MTEFLGGLTALVGLGQDMLWSVFLVFLRTGAVMAVLPAFGEQSVPQRVRLALALAFTAIVFPAIAPMVPPEDRFLLPVLTEVLAGLMIGLALRLFVMALQIAGVIIGQATSLAQLFASMGAEPLPAIGNLLVIAGLALAVNMGLHVRAAELMILSYDFVPPGRPPTAADAADWGLAQITRSFQLAFTLAAPFVIGALLYNLALGAINRAMPQLMVAFVGAPALSAGLLVMLAVVAPVALAVWLGALQRFLGAPFEVP